MAKLSPIDFKIGLPIILKVNDGQNKFELLISKDSAKIAIFRPKIGQLPLWRTIGRNKLIFYMFNSMEKIFNLAFFGLSAKYLRIFY